MLRINQNLSALTSADTLNGTNYSLQKSMEALSTGLRVNSVIDDASGVSDSEKMRSQISGYDMEIKNAQEKLSMLRTAEDALSNADSVLQKMRELATQSLSDTLTYDERKSIQTEIENLREKIYLDKKLPDGSMSALCSSGDSGLKAIINGSVDGTANYEIKITANAGQAQIQTSKIFEIYSGSYFYDTISNEKIMIVSESEATLSDIADISDETLSIIQGDGRMTAIKLEGSDTITQAAKKINDAIANSLGQGKYVHDSGKFAVISELTREELFDNGYRVNASLVIQSAVAGHDGEIFLTGNADLINALGFRTTQASSESTYEISIKDSDSGKNLLHEEKISGNKINGVINQNIDLEFDPVSGIQAAWDASRKQYILSGSDFTTELHITGRANTVQLGDMTSGALDIDHVNIMTRETASRSVNIIDNAIERIVRERAKIASYQSVIENDISRLTGQGKITDTDTAQSELRFTEFKILSQSQSAVLVQANQQPESIINIMNSHREQHYDE